MFPRGSGRVSFVTMRTLGIILALLVLTGCASMGPMFPPDPTPPPPDFDRSDCCSQDYMGPAN
jgi:predicted small lipoprotein YifL